jgi:4-hydroxy-tetrahydrodipicolinate synthase
MHEMCAAALGGNAARAIELNNRQLPLHRNLILEANPIPDKWALGRMGKIAAGLRLPLTPLSPNFQEPIAAALREAGCLQ